MNNLQQKELNVNNSKSKKVIYSGFSESIISNNNTSKSLNFFLDCETLESGSGKDFSLINLKSKQNITSLVMQGFWNSDLPKNILSTEMYRKVAKGLDCCQRFFIQGKCSEHEHYFNQSLICNKEFCPVCGEKNSKAHLRTVLSWKERLIGYDILGHIVITIPHDIQKIYVSDTSKRMKNLNRKIVSLFKNIGIDKGKGKIHWFGDKDWNVNRKDDLEGDKKGKKKPHIHIHYIFPRNSSEEYINRSDLDYLKNELTSYFKKQGSDVKRSVIHYRFAKEEYQKHHLIRYVTRATFKFKYLIHNLELAYNIYGMHKTFTFGKLKHFELKDYIEESDEEKGVIEKIMISLSKNVCPVCGSDFTWEKGIYTLNEINEVFQERMLDNKESYYYILHKKKSLERMKNIDQNKLDSWLYNRDPDSAEEEMMIIEHINDYEKYQKEIKITDLNKFKKDKKRNRKLKGENNDCTG